MISYKQYKLLAFLSVGAFWGTICLYAMGLAALGLMDGTSVLPYFGAILLGSTLTFSFAMIKMRSLLRKNPRGR